MGPVVPRLSGLASGVELLSSGLDDVGNSSFGGLMSSTQDTHIGQRDATPSRPAMPGSDASEDDEFDCQDIRLAVVMNGGVSLAIWISGVALELHHLAMARRWKEPAYLPLLRLLDAKAWVDVIAGTSAGGLNGAFLALGLVRDRDLGGLRDLWRDQGSLDKLLRDPLEKNPPSLFRGDDFFLGAIRDALSRVLDQDQARVGSGEVDRPVSLILTGTLWKGRATPFTDDMGAAITEVDHD